MSIIIPAYNGAGTIEHTLRSIAAQDYAPFELLVVDDASSDALSSVVSSTLDDGPLKARILRHPVNEGLSRTLNDGWRAAQGELVLILHQDIELLGADWLRRAVSALLEDNDVQVLTCHYGIPAKGELRFPSRAFGFLRWQFHEAPTIGREFVTFTEFKCDLVRKAALERIGGFPTEFRLAGEDILVSYRIRQGGGRILKAYDLRAVQRFAGRASSVSGNLWKDYRFGMAFGGVLAASRGYAFRDLDVSKHTRKRSLHRASQPAVAIAGVALLILALFPGWGWAILAFALLVAVRYVYYAVRLAPEFRRAVPGRARAAAETLAASALGLMTDIVYPLGFGVGLARAAVGAPL